jgi:hypothetical protein
LARYKEKIGFLSVPEYIFHTRSRQSVTGVTFGSLIGQEPDTVRRQHFIKPILATLVVAAFAACAHAGGGSNPTYDGVVDFGGQLLHLDDGCLSVGGTVVSGSFFENLKRIDVGGRLEYRKHGKVVTEYPESVTTSIRIVGDQCAAFPNSPSSVFNGDSYSLKFAVAWKDGMRLRPAVLSPGVARCVGYSSVTIPPRNYAIPSITCQMTVESKGIPLLDHLIVSVFAADGNRITRLSAAP